MRHQRDGSDGRSVYFSSEDLNWVPRAGGAQPPLTPTPTDLRL